MNDELPRTPTPPPRAPTPPLPTRPSGRVARKVNPPKRYIQPADVPKKRVRVKDILPPPPPRMPEPEHPEAPTLPVPAFYQTESDSFGVWREYSQGRPSFTPDLNYSLELQCNVQAGDILQNSSNPPPPSEPVPDYAPFENSTTHMIMDWYYGHGTVTKSQSELQALVHNVILNPSFKASELEGFNAARELKRMDKYQVAAASQLPQDSTAFFDDRWLEGTVYLSLPCDGFKFAKESDAPQFPIKFHYRKLLDVVKEAFSEPAAEHFHQTPFKSFWKPTPDSLPERIYGENHSGDYFNTEYESICANLRLKGVKHEAVVAGLMIWSDATCLAQFGTQQLWPIYLQVGNQSKYTRGCPESLASHHLAYLPKVRESLISLKLYI